MPLIRICDIIPLYKTSQRIHFFFSNTFLKKKIVFPVFRNTSIPTSTTCFLFFCDNRVSLKESRNIFSKIYISISHFVEKNIILPYIEKSIFFRSINLKGKIAHLYISHIEKRSVL